MSDGHRSPPGGGAAPGGRQLKVRVGGLSVAGKKAENQDAFGAFVPETDGGQLKGSVACLADGVSCSDHAALASQTSVNTFLSDYLSTPDTWAVREAAARVISSLNSWLYQQGHSLLTRENGLVTTFSALILKSRTLHGFHVGDTRIYRWRNGSLEQLTRDHQAFAAGSGVLTRGLGMEAHIEVDYFRDSVEVGDLYVLTSDGVHGFTDLKAFLEQAGHVFVLRKPSRSGLETLAKSLVEEALQGGSQDNLSCLFLAVTEVPDPYFEEAQRLLEDKVLPPAMEPGNRLENYEVEEIIHLGTRSTVYRVRELGTARRLAMKVPGERFADDAQYLESFHRECWIASRVSHPALLKPYLPANESPFLYQLYEYVEGPTLRQWMHDNPRPDPESVRKIIEPLVSALRALQRRGMVHRDIKPENILLPGPGKPVIVDYGTVQVAGLQDLGASIEEGEVPVGSVDYIAPEYLLQNTASALSDLFSLAAITYEMLSGEPPYQFRNMVYRPPKSFDAWHYRSLRQFRPDLPQWLDLSLQKALQPRPGKRHQAFSEFLQDLRQANPALLAEAFSRPLIQRNPLRFWQSVCGVLILLALAQAWLLSQG